MHVVVLPLLCPRMLPDRRKRCFLFRNFWEKTGSYHNRKGTCHMTKKGLPYGQPLHKKNPGSYVCYAKSPLVLDKNFSWSFDWSYSFKLNFSIVHIKKRTVSLADVGLLKCAQWEVERSCCFSWWCPGRSEWKSWCGSSSGDCRGWEGLEQAVVHVARVGHFGGQ